MHAGWFGEAQAGLACNLSRQLARHRSPRFAGRLDELRRRYQFLDPIRSFVSFEWKRTALFKTAVTTFPPGTSSPDSDHAARTFARKLSNSAWSLLPWRERAFAKESTWVEADSVFFAA